MRAHTPTFPMGVGDSGRERTNARGAWAKMGQRRDFIPPPPRRGMPQFQILGKASCETVDLVPALVPPLLGGRCTQRGRDGS